MLFTSPRDELSCQKLISPPDPNQFRGLCKIQPSGWHIKHQAWEKTARWRGIYRSFFFFFFLCGCFSLSHVLFTAGFLRNINTRLFQGQKMKWLISVLTVRTHTHTHTLRCRDACGTIEARLLLQPDSSLSGKRDLGNEKPSVRSWPV